MTTTAKTIYDKLKTFGLKPAQVRALLPEWWSAEAEKTPDGLAELCTLISRRLSLDLPALMKGDVRLRGVAESVAYKHSADATPEALQAATAIATSLAQAVVAAMPEPYAGSFGRSAEVTARVRAAGNGVVGLTSLINTCWSMGVPVIPLPNLPLGIRKMDGAVIKVGDRPAIIVSKKKSSRAWLSFIVAHEIGHIARGHLKEANSIVDVSLQEHSEYEAESTTDIQERQADQFALEILGGEEVETSVKAWSQRASPVELAVLAREASQRLGIESGHFVLRYAFISRRWPDAVSALRFLSEDADAETIMKQALQRNLNLELVSSDMQDLVCRITGIS